MRKLLLLSSLLLPSLFASAQAIAVKPDWLKSASLYDNGGPTQVNGIAAGSDGSVTAVGYIHGTVDFQPGPDTVLATATGTYDIYIAKYSKAGRLVYAHHFGSKGGTAYEAAYAVTTDNDGNAYVTGNFNGTIDFDPGAGVALLSAASTEIFIVSYDKNGVFRYAIKATSTASDNKVQNVKSIVVDKQRNVYITGSFIGSVDFDPGDKTAQLGAVGLDAFFAKYDAKGNYRFAKKLGGEGDDVANDMALDKQNNIVLCGGFTSASADFDPGPGRQLLSTHGNEDIYFAKYDTAGNYLFAKGIGALSDDGANALAVTSDNGIVVAGSFRGKNVDFDAGNGSSLLNSNYIDAFVTRYSSNGDFEYAFTIGGTGEDYITDIAADSGNNYFVTGNFYGSNVDFDPGSPVYNVPVTEGQTKFIAKYTGAGAFVFANSIGTASRNETMYNAYVNFSSLAVDKSGNLLAGGNFSDTLDVDPGTGRQLIYEPYSALLVVTYKTDGTYKNSLNTDNYFDYYNASSTVEASVTDDSGNVYTAGTINGRYDFDTGPGTYILESLNDYRPSVYFAKYTKTGTLVYAKAIIGASFISGMVLDKDNDIYLTGIANSLTDFDPGVPVVHWNNNTLPDAYGFFFAKYTNNGDLRYAKGVKTEVEGYSAGIAVDKQKNVYVVGFFGYESADFDPGAGKKILTPLGTNDFYYTKYDSSGNYVFAYNIGSAGDLTYQKATDIKLSSKGNLVICGSINGSNIDFDPGPGQFFLSGSTSGFIATYKSDGSFVNAFAISVVDGGYGRVNMNTLTLDASDNVYVAGDYFGKVDFDPGNARRYIKAGNGIFVASYSKTGAYRFAQGSYTYPENTSISRIALDKDRNIYIGGYFNTPVLDLDFGADSALIYNEAYHYPDYFNTDIFFAKYDSLCNYTYGYDIGGDSANGTNIIYSLNIERSGDIVIGGLATTKLDFDPGSDSLFLQPTALYYNLFVAKYSPLAGGGRYEPTLFTAAVRSALAANPETALSLSPNPATNYIWVTANFASSPPGTATVRVYSGAGTCVLAEQAAVHNSSIQLRLPVSQLAKGNYFITVTGGGQVLKKSFVIQ